jgi:hypothetical protein
MLRVTCSGSRAVACGCRPGGIGRSARMPCYPWDISDGEWAVTEPALPTPAWRLGKAAGQQSTAAATSPARWLDTARAVPGRGVRITMRRPGFAMVTTGA